MPRSGNLPVPVSVASPPRESGGGGNGTRRAPRLDMSGRHDIQARTFALACQIINFCRHLARSDYVIRRLASQLLDAGTSIGANLEEADAAQTKRDFIAKAAIARKESAETRYWLRLIAFALPAVKPQAEPLIDESLQILKILTTIIKNAESNPDRGHQDPEQLIIEH